MSELELRLSVQETKMEAVEANQRQYTERFDRIESRLERIDGELVSIHGRISEVQSSLESKIADVRVSLEDKIARLQSSLEGKITDLHGKIAGIHDKIADLHAAFNRQTRWILIMFGAFIAGVFGLLFKLFPLLDAMTKAFAR